MKRRPLGRTGCDVSAIGLGCMGMSEFYGPSDDAQSLDTLAAALDLGVDFLDTADIYGHGRNEELVGRFLKDKRDRIVLATKFAIVRDPKTDARRIDNSPAYIRQACEASLKRLGVDTIDLYYCHRRNPDQPVEDTVGAMAELVTAGKVRWLGLSEVSSATLRRAHVVHPITALQSEYSLWSREPEKEVLATCRALGVTFVAYSPLGRAFLTGKIESPDSLAAGDFRRSNPRFKGSAFAHNKKLADGLAGFAKTRGATPAQIALAWILSKQPEMVPIPGTRRKTYLAENAAAADIELTEADIAALDALFPPAAAEGDRYASMANIEA
jgi:aryl-alcohol dehydrogenase-like predicted oxidoreductase